MVQSLDTLRLTSKLDASIIAELATRSLLYEVSVSPKPGLVDRFDNGAHSDMDFFTFLNSSTALTEYFRSAYLLGKQLNRESPSSVFLSLRKLGIQAEAKMYASTDGVNTHKGTIFTFGLFCGALGWISNNVTEIDADRFLLFCGHMVAPTLEAELSNVSTGNSAAKTGGERFFAATGCGGIRSEASAGYPSLRTCGLPALRCALEQGYSYNDAGILVLLKLMCCVQDSNIFSRCGPSKQQQLSSHVRKILDEPRLDLSQIEELNRLCIQDRVSPGGCADLLAATFFLHFLFDL